MGQRILTVKNFGVPIVRSPNTPTMKKKNLEN